VTLPPRTASHDDRGDRVRSAVTQLRNQPRREARPVVLGDIDRLHSGRAHRADAERIRPFRPRSSVAIEGADDELRAVLIDDSDPPTGFARDPDLQSRNPALWIVLEVGQPAFDQRVSR
jgi:hypothetical protein